MINLRLRFESVLEQRVEAGVNNNASARVIKPLGLYPQLVRSVAFLKIRNLARYDPIGLLTMLMDEEQNNYDNIITSNNNIKNCQRLFLDLNCCIHYCANEILNFNLGIVLFLFYLLICTLHKLTNLF